MPVVTTLIPDTTSYDTVQLPVSTKETFLNGTTFQQDSLKYMSTVNYVINERRSNLDCCKLCSYERNPGKLDCTKKRTHPLRINLMFSIVCY